MHCTEIGGEYDCSDEYYNVVAPQFWNDTWHSTISAHYDTYFTRQQVAAIRDANMHVVRQLRETARPGMATPNREGGRQSCDGAM